MSEKCTFCGLDVEECRKHSPHPSCETRRLREENERLKKERRRLRLLLEDALFFCENVAINMFKENDPEELAMDLRRALAGEETDDGL